MMRIRRAFGVLLIGSVVLVGCGDGDDDDDASSPSATSVTDSTTGGSATGDPAADQARCTAAATAMAQAGAAVPQGLYGTAAGTEGTAETLRAFADTAPAAVGRDLRTVADGYSSFAKVLADTNYNPASGQPPSEEALAALEDANEKLEESDFLEAANRVSAWFQTGCPA